MQRLAQLFSAESKEDFEIRLSKATGDMAAQLGEPKDGEEQDQQYLKRFAIANELDVGKAIAHIHQERAWRKEKFPLTLTAQQEEVFTSKRVRYVGVNTEGFGVYAYDFMWGKFLEGCNVDDVIQAQTFMIENVIAEMREKAPDGPGRWISICLGGPPPSAWSKKAASVFERYYPERLERVIIYPVPHFMKKVVDAIIYWLPARTKAKFAIISTEEELRELAGIPAGGAIEMPADMLGGIDAVKERMNAKGQAVPEMREGEKLDLVGMDAEARAALELQAASDPELRRILDGEKEDELYRLQMQA